MTFRGKYFVIVFASIIGVLFIGGLAVNSRLTELSDRIEEQRLAWPRTAEVLDRQLAYIDQVVATGSSQPLREEWSLAKAAYEESKIYDRQSRKFIDLIEVAREVKLAEVAPAATKPSLANSEMLTLQAFITTDKAIETSSKDMVGRITQALLDLDYPPRLYSEIEWLTETLASN